MLVIVLSMIENTEMSNAPLHMKQYTTSIE